MGIDIDKEKQIQRKLCEAINKQTRIIWTPGHTSDSLCLFYAPPINQAKPSNSKAGKPVNILFSGDHIYFRNDDRLHASIQYNHYSLSAQARSIRRLMEEDFHIILPNHGRWGVVKPLPEPTESNYDDNTLPLPAVSKTESEQSSDEITEKKEKKEKREKEEEG